MVSKEKIEELRKIFKEDFGAELTDQEVHDAAFNLVGYYDTLMQCAAEDVQEYMRTGELSSDRRSSYDKWIVSKAEELKKQADNKTRPV